MNSLHSPTATPAQQQRPRRRLIVTDSPSAAAAECSMTPGCGCQEEGTWPEIQRAALNYNECFSPEEEANGTSAEL